MTLNRGTSCRRCKNRGRGSSRSRSLDRGNSCKRCGSRRSSSHNRSINRGSRRSICIIHNNSRMSSSGCSSYRIGRGHNNSRRGSIRNSNWSCYLLVVKSKDSTILLGRDCFSTISSIINVMQYVCCMLCDTIFFNYLWCRLHEILVEVVSDLLMLIFTFYPISSHRRLMSCPAGWTGTFWQPRPPTCSQAGSRCLCTCPWAIVSLLGMQSTVRLIDWIVLTPRRRPRCHLCFESKLVKITRYYVLSSTYVC